MIKTMLLGCTMLTAVPALAQEASPVVQDAGGAGQDGEGNDIVVTGVAEQSTAGTKTYTPLVEVPQPITVVTDEVFTAQGAVSISDTLRYVAGVTANPYGPDSRVDGGTVRGLDALQFRDGMRDIFSYYASIRADPYNFSQVELVRGPAGVLFGAGSLGGILNLVSKRPESELGGEVSLRHGSHDRKEALADISAPLTEDIAARLAVRVRDSDSQVDFVPDDRVMIAPSVSFRPDADTNITLLGLYQEDDGGSTSQFLPLVGTILPNPNGQLPNNRFIGKPGWDRYSGRLAQGTALFEHRFSNALKVNLKARYLDSDLDYFTHYPNSYDNPTNPYVLLDETGQPVLDEDGLRVPDPEQRTIGLYADATRAQMEVFSTDNNVQFNFNTGSAIQHTVLAGLDYSWSRVRKVGFFAEEFIDIYDIDYDAISDFGGGLPTGAAPSEDGTIDQLGLYLQDQIRILDRVSIVLGVRHDDVDTTALGSFDAIEDSATTFRAGIIAEVLPGVSPFFSYTESFEPIAGVDSAANPFRPKQGHQFEAGLKFHPGRNVLVTVTGYHIVERNRPVDDPTTPDPFDQRQLGRFTSQGVEFEASVALPGDFALNAAASYNEAEDDATGLQVDNAPKENASLWGTKGFNLGNDVALRVGAGVRYAGENYSYGPAFPNGLRTPDYTLVDALAEISWKRWSFRVNATNLFDEKFYSACLARGDCFNGEDQNIFGTLSYRF